MERVAAREPSAATIARKPHRNCASIAVPGSLGQVAGSDSPISSTNFKKRSRLCLFHPPADIEFDRIFAVRHVVHEIVPQLIRQCGHIAADRSGVLQGARANAISPSEQHEHGAKPERRLKQVHSDRRKAEQGLSIGWQLVKSSTEIKQILPDAMIIRSLQNYLLSRATERDRLARSTASLQMG